MNRTLRLGGLALGSLMVFAGLGGPVACGSANVTGMPLDGQGGNAGATSTGGTTAVDGFGEACTSDKQCKEYNLLCDTALGCVECVAPTDCPAPSQGEAACTAGKCGALIPCENSLDCPDDSVCDTAAGKCAECVGDDDCTGDQVCVQGSCASAPECTTSDDCASGQDCIGNACVTVATCNVADGCANGLHCEEASGTCVECLTQDDCDTGETCVNNHCITMSGTCDKPRVIVLVQRSGGMFDNGWWDPLRSALSDATGLIDQFKDKLDVGVMLFHRDGGNASCPLLDEAALPAQPAAVKTLMDDAETAYGDTAVKVDAPFPEAIAAAQAKLPAGGNPPFIVLINASVPDTCTISDTPCSIDPVIGAVQDAKAAGITTYVMGLADVQFAYQDYFLQAVANAGQGQPVKTLDAPFDGTACAISSLAGSYAETGGNATSYIAEAPTDVKTGLESIFNQMRYHL